MMELAMGEMDYAEPERRDRERVPPINGHLDRVAGCAVSPIPLCTVIY